MDPRKITESRKTERELMTQADRQVRAIEDIADTLEALRVAFVSWARQPARG